MSPSDSLTKRQILGDLVVSGALALALVTPSAQAREATVVLHTPESGEVQTTLTGRSRAASIAMPEGPASMTPRWLIANADLHWSCPDGLARELRVQTPRGPHATPRTFDLRPLRLQEGSTHAELYLWEVAAVKAACTRDGEVQLASLPVQLILQCEQGPEVQGTRTVTLQVHCRPSVPSEETATGLSVRSRFVLLTPEPSQYALRLGQEHTVVFSPLPREALTPHLQSLRLVQLDARDKVVQRYPPLSPTEAPFEPRLTFTPRRTGTLRFALEAEYLDGSRLLSGPAELEVLTEQQAAAEAARRVPAEKRMAFLEEVARRVEASACGPELVAWIKQQPIIADASQLKPSNIWYRFTDGLMGTVHCH